MSSTLLARVGDIVAALGGNTPAAVERARLLRASAEVSDDFARRTQRQFKATVSTWYPVWSGKAGGVCPVTGLPTTSVLWLPEFTSISALAVDNDNNGSYELTLVQDTDYRVWQFEDADWPYELIYLDPNGTQLSQWPTNPRNIRVAGVRGWSYETELTGQTVANNPLASGGTTLTVASTVDISNGETLVLDSEQVYVSAGGDAAGTSLTIERAVNGATAAAHISGTAIYRRRYPRRVEAAVRAMVGFRGGASGDAAEFGQFQGLSASPYADYMTAVREFRRVAVG